MPRCPSCATPPCVIAIAASSEPQRYLPWRPGVPLWAIRDAAAFRQDLPQAVHDTDAVIVTFDLCAGVLLAHHPELADRVVIRRAQKDKLPWHWPSPDRVTVRMTGNVLTCGMFPVAFALSDHVQIAGRDGRAPAENYFWRHNARTQYSDELMGTVFDTHPPSFFDRDYADCYDERCRQLEELLAVGEAAGRRATAVTPSDIPALRQRGAPALGS